ncbi:hypothetical protein BDZ97DRAFT_1655524 [Flammula alnicola]|nr:hypothetical protein BDZ97DRAFT_1655524 [Flammula alnicola]
MASNSLSLVLDDTSGAFQFGPRAWANSSLVQWYGGTSVFPDFAAGATSNSSSAVFGSFLVTFQGTSIAFVGNTPAAPSSQSIAVSIDGGAEYETSYDDPTPQSYLQWYQSPTLPEGTHTIAVNQVAGTSLDYAIVTVGPNTPLTGKTILLDNEDPAIQYSGGWTRNTDRFDAGNLPDGLPYHNSTHRSSTPGDIITFRFQGTSAQIYGIFSWFNIGILSATYTLDGTTVPQTYAVATNTPEFVSNQGEAANFLLFSYNNLPAGDHTLVINITRCVNQTFILDYITYSPSFLNLAAMPALPVLSPSSVSIVPTGSSATNTPTATSATTSTTSQVGQPGTLQTVSKKVPIAAIVGGVVGGILLIFAFLCLWIRIRRSKKESAKSLMQIEGDESSHAPSYSELSFSSNLPLFTIMGERQHHH